MDPSITRRDFVNGVAMTIGAGLTPASLRAAALAGPYPPARTGMRGNHPGAFDDAHAVGWKQKSHTTRGQPVDEEYDLVVVGAGLSGLAAAHRYRAKHPAARILILDNHDDFGGHAKRNEFRHRGRLLVSYGGSESLQSPKALFSETMHGLMRTLRVDLERFTSAFDRHLYPSMGLSRGVFFDAANFGRDVLVPGDPTPQVADDILPHERNAKPLAEFIAGFPLSEKARRELVLLHTEPRDFLAGNTREQKEALLASTSYYDFLVKHARVSPEAARYFQGRSLDFYALGTDSVSAAALYELGYPGFAGLGLEPPSAEAQAELAEPYIYHFPDGNASLARLLVRALMPHAVPGKSMEDIVLARVDYEALDRAGTPVRLRLSSTAVVVENTAGPVSVGYVRAGALHHVRARNVVLACFNMMAGHLVPELGDAQRVALRACVKTPLVYSKVLVKNWHAFVKLGVHEIYSPTAFHSRVKLDYPVHLGGYRSPTKPSEPMVLHLVHVPYFPHSRMTAREQAHAGRAKLLGMPFSDFEREIRAQLDVMLSPGGFDARRDIAAITVNRWAHGYAYAHNSLYDRATDEDEIPARARQKVGRVTIANSDAAWDAYAHTAVDQAARAVDELED